MAVAEVGAPPALLYAGEIAGALTLKDELRRLHDEDRAAKIAELMRRKANNAPADGIVDPGPFVEKPEHEGVTLKVRVLSERKRSAFEASHLAAEQRYHLARAKADDAVSKAKEAGDAEAEAELLIAAGPKLTALAGAIYDEKSAFVAAVVEVVDVRGQTLTQLDAEDLNALERAKLIVPIYNVALSVQVLGAKKAPRSGPSAA